MLPLEDILTCPSCHGNLLKQGFDWKCEKDNLTFTVSGGINNFIHPQRKETLSRFLSIYQTNRSEEHWGNQNPEYYLSLPYTDTSGKHTSLWKMRAKSFDIFLDLIETSSLPKTPLLLDLGAGNCWLSLQMARKGFHVIASDINIDDDDGLGVLSRIQPSLTDNIHAVQAEFNYLPFQHNIFDIIVMNGSLHYSSDIRKTIDTSMHFLAPKGMLCILDSPMYNHISSGRKMIEARADALQQKYGNTLPEEFIGSYLTDDDIQSFSTKYKTTVRKPDFGLMWNIRSKVMPFLLQRETASFTVIMLQKQS